MVLEQTEDLAAAWVLPRYIRSASKQRLQKRRRGQTGGVPPNSQPDCGCFGLSRGRTEGSNQDKEHTHLVKTTRLRGWELPACFGGKDDVLTRYGQGSRDGTPGEKSVA